MNPSDRPLSDRRIEAGIARRIGGHADPALLQSIVARASRVPQERTRARFDAGRLRLMAVLVAAALGAAGVGILASGSRPAVPHVPTRPALSPYAPVQPVVTPQVDQAQASASNGSCATETVTVSTGSAMPSAEAEPANVPAGIGAEGVYLTNLDGGSIQRDVWAVRSGLATRIASIVDPGINVTRVDDLSADGTLAIVDVGVVHGGLPGPMCDDLYLIRTDGGGATRLTTNGPNHHATGGSFSRDGRYVGYRSHDDVSGVSRLDVVDLEGDRTPREADCNEAFYELPPRWAPTDDRVAAQCGGALLVAQLADGSNDGLARPMRFDLPSADDLHLDIRWISPTQLLLVNAASGTSSNGPIDLRTVTFDATSVPAGHRISAATDVVPRVSDGGLGGSQTALSPDGRAFTILADLGMDDPSGAELGLFVVDIASAHATRFTGWPIDGFGWSADGRAILYVDVQHDGPTLTLRERAATAPSATAPLPQAYEWGIWRGVAAP